MPSAPLSELRGERRTEMGNFGGKKVRPLSPRDIFLATTEMKSLEEGKVGEKKCDVHMYRKSMLSVLLSYLRRYN